MKKHFLTLAAICLLTATAATRAADAKAEAKADKVKPYILKVCIVSGEKLGEMGKPTVITNELREIKFCCSDCVKDFKKNPTKYIKKLEVAEAKEKKKKS